MNIHEYQSKNILRQYGVNVPNGHVAYSIDEAVEYAKGLQTDVKVVKAQIHAGGRGKAGGVKVAHNLDEVREYAKQILGKVHVTPQTGLEGKKVKRLLIKEEIDPSIGLTGFQARRMAFNLNFPNNVINKVATLLLNLYKVFIEKDCMTAEINPLVTTKEGDVLALDAKMNFDGNALYRQKDVLELRDLDEEDRNEIEASK